jgi:hypothetical protein
MHTVINHLHLNLPAAEMAATLQQGADLLATYPGFHAAYISQEDADRVAVVIVWETQQDAETAAAKFGPSWFAENLAPRLASPQERSAGPVIASAES